MDERSHHGYPQQPQQQAAPEYAPPMHHAPVASPWPSYAPPAQHAPIAGHAPHHAPQHHAMPTMQQFQYAAQGYVVPGAPAGQGAPMSAHGGTIGVAQPQVMSGGMAQPLPAPIPMHHAPHMQAQQQLHAPMHDAYGRPQAWAFPTPNGMQPLQPGATSMAQPQHGAIGMPTARRMRWETIVPALAVICLVAAIGLFMHDFDRITGRDMKSSNASTTTPSAEQDVEAGGTAPEAVEPAPTDAPMTTAPVTKARYDALAARLAKERRAKQWPAVIRTIGQMEQVGPLNRSLVSLRTRARAAMTAARARAKADAARAAAAAKRAASPSGGDASGPASPPVARGSSGSSSSVRPPADAPKGPIPTAPSVPNPTGGSPSVMGGGPAASGTGANCHAHDGITSCHD